MNELPGYEIDDILMDLASGVLDYATKGDTEHYIRYARVSTCILRQANNVREGLED